MNASTVASSVQRTALVMAGGTGGHIFPGLAVAQALRERGWRVLWLGAPDSMESRLVPARGFALETIAFSGVRGKGLKTLALLPLRLARAIAQSAQVLRRVRPDVVLGFGGYISTIQTKRLDTSDHSSVALVIDINISTPPMVGVPLLARWLSMP